MIINSQQKDDSNKVVQISEGGFGTTSEEEFYQMMLNIIRPIGSLYITSEAVHPSDLFGGEWEQIKNALLINSDDNHPVSSSGGSFIVDVPLMSHSHSYSGTLTSGGHYHGVQPRTGYSQPGNPAPALRASPSQTRVYSFYGGAHSHTFNGTVNQAGNYTSASRCTFKPPIQNVYIWKRVN